MSLQKENAWQKAGQSRLSWIGHFKVEVQDSSAVIIYWFLGSASVLWGFK